MLQERHHRLAQRVRDGVRRRGDHVTSTRTCADPDDLAVRDTDEELAMALMQTASQTLVRLEHALRRLDDGEYGNCAECHAAIASARLEALPFAIRCIDCEARREAALARDAPRRGSSSVLDDVSD